LAPTPRKSALKKSDSGESRAAGDKRPRRTSTKPFGEREEEKPFKAKKEEGDSTEERSPKSRSRKDSFDEPKEFVKKPYAERRNNYIPEKLTHAQTGKIRLNRYVANSGICSRREADELIRLGLVSVNGKVITEMGYKVNFGDEVRYENKVLTAEKPVYILMNKPKGYITTTDDPQERNTVMHILAGSVKERVYPVGRLDRNTTGLLLLTNDGDLAEKLMHPSYNVKKIYKVELDRPIAKADLQKIADGIVLEEGRAMVDEVAVVSDDFKTVGIEIHIGWNRIIRRIFESLSYEVVRLDRSVYAGLDKKDLGRGHWRYLTREEVVRLKHLQ
jgi:23S rRNA pseudouridine2605 synthase